MISIKNKKAIFSMKETGKRLSSLFYDIENLNYIGMKTLELDNKIFEFLEKYKLTSQANDYCGFKGYSCISLNDSLVHGVPSDEIIKENDFIKIDICASYNGYCADMARMYTKNKENNLYKKIIECGEKAISKAFIEIYDGNYLSNVGNSIQKIIEEYGFSVVKDFCGHGIGKNMHEAPEVLNWGERNTGIKMRYGMAFAVEPMFCEKKADIYIDKKDKWTAKTCDKGIAGHIEDTVIVCDNGPIITTR